MKFEVVEGQEHEETISRLRKIKKWHCNHFDDVSRDYIFSEISKQLKHDLDGKIFAFLCYLTSGRRNEVASVRKDDIRHHKLIHNDEKYDVIVIRLYNQKNKEKKRKYIPLVKGLDDVEDEMIRQFENFIEDKDTRIFPEYSSVTTWSKKLEKVKFEARYEDKNMAITEEIVLRFNLFPHYLRHCRLTHLNWLSAPNIISLAGWSSNQLKNMMGSAATMVDKYMSRNWEDIAKEMINHGI